MKQQLLICTAALSLLMPCAVTAKRVPAKVQGIDYASTLRQDGRMKAASDWEWDPNPDAPALPANEFTSDDIQNWTGEGANKAALIIQWNDERETNAIVFGYRWDGLATGADMIKAVVKNNPRLYTLMQYTNVSSPTDPNGGYTINGFGWDADNDGDISLMDSKDGQLYTSEDGFFEHPRGYNPEVGGSSDYDYDDWVAMDDGDYWGAGWYLNYWSYWVGELGSDLDYSSWGASGRVLEDGCCDGWNYSVYMIPRDWKDFKAAPSTIPDGAKTEFKVGDLFYQLTDFQKGSVKLVNPSALTTIEGAAYRDFTGEAIVIPATFTDGAGDDDKAYTVTEIAEGAFADVTGITSVTIPATVKKIGNRAFYKCIDLAEVKGTRDTDLNSSLTSIGAQTFEGCTALRTLILPVAMKNIPARTYYGCELVENLLIPAQVETIGDEAFAATAVKSVEIPANLKKIGAKAFAGEMITSVKSESLYPAEMAADAFTNEVYAAATLTVPTGFTGSYAAAEGWSKFANVSEINVPVNEGDVFAAEGVTYNVTDISEEAPAVKVSYAKIDGAPNKNKIEDANKSTYTGEITIPATVRFMGRDYKVTAINDSAFYGASELTSVRIAAPVEKIGAHTFYYCSKLTNVELPATVKEIGTYAFSNSGITGMSLPAGIQTLGSRAFFYCDKMESINFPSSLTAIGDNCFSYCQALSSADMSATTAELGAYLFQSAIRLAEVKLPAGLTSIPNYMFSSCSTLRSASIPESVTTIGNNAFAGCTNYVVELPDGVTSIGSQAFSGCANETFTLPSAITAVPTYLFQNCKSLHEVTLGNNVTSIGNYAFSGCTALTTLNTATDDNRTEGDTPAREGAAGLHFPAALTSIGNSAFTNTPITSVTVPESVTSLGTNVFQNCKSLTEAYLPGSVTTPGAGTFYGCTELRHVTLSEGMTTVSQNMFRDCNNLEKIVAAGEESEGETVSVKLPSTVKTIGTWTFTNCKKITSAEIPANVTSLGSNTFDGCSSLASVELPSTLTTLGAYCFRNTALAELVLPASLGNTTSSDIINGCPSDIKVYVTNQGAPKTAGTYTWRTATGVYPVVMVPSGLKAKYETMTGWKSCQISEPEVTSVDFTIEAGTLTESDAEILVAGTVNYAGELPEAFRAANDGVIFTGDAAEFMLSRRVTEVNLPSSQQYRNYAEEDEEPVVETLALAADGTCGHIIERPEFTTTYAVKVSGSHAAGSVDTPEVPVKITGWNVESGMTEVFDLNDADTEVYTLDGLRVSPENGLTTGTYIVRRGTKTMKIQVK